MQFQRVTSNQDVLYAEGIALYERSFITAERRDADEQRRIMQESDYHFDAIVESDGLCGVVLYWESDDFIYLEHLAILESLRGKSIGTQALEYLKSKGKMIIIEIEPVVDEMTARRRAFYERNGFFVTSHHHIQVKYRFEDSEVELWILSLGRIISAEEYEAFYEYLLRKVQIQPRPVEELTVEPLQEGEDFEAVAELIYYSDNYIYPYMFKGVEEGRRVLAEMIRLDTPYHYSNIVVAKLGGEIVGAVVALPAPISVNENAYKMAFAHTMVEFNDRHARIWREYYQPMTEVPDGVYIANACVSSACRGKGVAKELFRQIFATGEVFHLECVQANVNALALYQKLGFIIEHPYPGLFEVPCYKMKRGE